ncbi:hypothetical protein BpHYR1_004993 [Brachionus plicatilis]|uniref:Uncharacterized protein n=1 Tax=Brachionus plicatilis TaxID=10195 RepID=A0A3M7S373_BRAPC|nr:hypothetical protein BpHYR1_004993 [Brachionus plicatilis]
MYQTKSRKNAKKPRVKIFCNQIPGSAKTLQLVAFFNQTRNPHYEFLFNLCLKFTIPSQSKFNFVSPFDHLIMIMNFKLPTKATQKKVEHENSEIRRILVYFRTDSQGPPKILTPTYLTNQKYF